jgi:amicyanin
VKYLSMRTSILGILVGLLCVAALGYVANSSTGAVTALAADRPAAVQPGAQAEKTANQVVIDNFKFEPRQLTVKAGTKVTWVNRDDVPHTATSTARPKAFDSKTLDTDQKFSHVFPTAGTYEYFCAVHPHMKGKIVVK